MILTTCNLPRLKQYLKNAVQNMLGKALKNNEYKKLSNYSYVLLSLLNRMGSTGLPHRDPVFDS